jgi:sugar O-acyltransferase (sialic acid O-acetyltransferase NeuD family)
MDKPVIIFGAKGIAQAAMEIFQSHGIVVYGFLDDDPPLHGELIQEVPVLGNTEDHGYLKLIGQKCEAFVANDDAKMRKQLVKFLMEQRKVMPTNAVHARAHVAPSAFIGHGNFINAGAVIGSSVKVGQHCIVHSGAILEAGVELADYVQIGPGAVIGPEVKIAEGAFVGAGANLVGSISVGKNARIGAGSVVISSVADKQTVFGNPAQTVKA